MKVCVLYGSPRKTGATAKLLDDFLASLPQESETVRFDAYDTSVRPCVACGACAKTGKCAFSDMDSVYDAIEQSDLLVIATPVYNLSAPAPLKAMLDRLQPYFERRFSLGQKPPIEKPRDAVFLLSYASDKYGGATHLTQALRMICTVLNARVVKVVTQKTA